MKTENNSLPIRDDLSAALQRAWNRLSQPGTWWDGTAMQFEINNSGPELYRGFKEMGRRELN